ncbi:MAG: Fic family protein [Candidatus Cryptobacteroides sp.]
MLNDFDKYITQGEPDKSEKAIIWQSAIGLQDVDGLKPSEYLIRTAELHIEGDITITEVKSLIDSYYESKSVRQDIDRKGTEEADKVAARITEILSEKSFNFTPDFLIRIHQRLFSGIYEHAGRLRQKNIIKKEWVLDGDTVIYSGYDMIRQTLEYDFSQEEGTDYPAMSADDAIKRICKFVSGLWQIHPFAEGNTRTTAVFTMKYLQTFGFKPDNSLFKEHSWYFRNALVRANYNNFHKGVSATEEFLVKFFRNLLLEENNTLSNRAMHISNSQSLSSKSQDDTLNCTLEEMAILKFLKMNPEAKQEEIAKSIGKSLSTVKRLTPSLVQRGLLSRENGKRNGRWVVSDLSLKI